MDRSRRASAAAALAAGSQATSAFALARARFADADYEGCLAVLAFGAFDADVEALVLRARAALRTGDVALAETASAAGVAHALPGSVAVGAWTTRAAVLRARGQHADAEAAFERAAEHLAAASPEARAEYAYQRAAAAWEDRDLAEAERRIDSGLAEATGFPRAMLVQLLGWIEVRRERYAPAALHFRDALDELDAGRNDARLRARLVHALALIASETIDLRLASRVEGAFATVSRAAGVARERFNTITCLRFIALLRGDLPGAWVWSRTAIDAAPTAAFRAIAETNAAVVAALVGDRFAADVQLRRAWDLIEATTWSAADDEERVALTNFAIEGARAMPAQARSAITLYRSISGRDDAGLAIRGDRRMQAFEWTAAGRVAEIVGDRDEAVTCYARALRLWSALDYRMRAGVVAQDLLRLTDDPQYRDDLDVALARAPHAWFARADAPERVPLAELSPAETVVLRYLLGGEGMREIAARLDRSAHTVHNHTRRIFAAFGVHKRAALVARCAELGITADGLLADVRAREPSVSTETGRSRR